MTTKSHAPPTDSEGYEIKLLRSKIHTREGEGIFDGSGEFRLGEALKIRHQRQESLHRGLFMMLYDEIAESAQRKYIRMLQSVGMAGDTIELEQ